MKKIAFQFLTCFVVLTNVLFAQGNSDNLDELIGRYFSAGPGYAIQIDKNGETIYRKAVGLANLETGSPLSNDHVFRIGSITKQFTAAGILRLVERGEINLGDPINRFIPDYPLQGEHITVEHLLTHTSGIKSYTQMGIWDANMQRQDLSPDELIDLFKGEALEFKPGTKFHYNNSGYVLLGKIIEEVSRKSYAEFLEIEFFGPLGMNHTKYEGPQTSRVSGYSVGKYGEYVEAAYLNMTQPYAAGALVSTTDDLSKWYHAVFADKVLSKEMREKAHTPYVLNNGQATRYGYGWFINQVGNSKVVMHSGGISGFSAASVFLPQEKVFVVVLSNCDKNPTDQLIKKLAACVLGKSVSMPARGDLSNQDLCVYEGTYQLSADEPIWVSIRDGKLLGKAPYQAEVELIPIAKDVFFVQQEEIKLKFNMDKNGQVKSLTLYEEGVRLARKLE